MPFKLEAQFPVETSLEFSMQFEPESMINEWDALFLIQNLFCHYAAIH